MQPILLELGSYCTAALFVGDVPLFALADGTMHRCVDGDHSARAHSALLAAAATADGQALLTSGDDGRICRTDGFGQPVELAAVPRKWIGCVASSSLGPFAFAAGRSLWLQDKSSPPRELQHPRSIAAIAFSPDGARIAVARYNGVTIHSAVQENEPVELEWRGIYTGLTFSLDGRFLLAAMQENLLHGWCVEDGRHFRMKGYPTKVKNWAWSADGRRLATSGASAAIVWPFDGLDGPMGKTALEVSASRGEALVTAVAYHPLHEVLAIGYSDGALVVAEIDADDEALVRESGRGALTSVAWHDGGERLAFGSEFGECAVVDVPQRHPARKSVSERPRALRAGPAMLR